MINIDDTVIDDFVQRLEETAMIAIGKTRIRRRFNPRR